MAAVDKFLESLNDEVPELPDIETADLQEDSRALWTRSERIGEDDVGQDVIPKRRLIATLDLDDEQYAGKKISSKDIFDGESISEIARPSFSKRVVIGDEDSDSEDRMQDEETADDTESNLENSSVRDESEEEESESQKSSASGDGESVRNFLSTVSSKSQELKGQSVRDQLLIWDRIMHLQILSHAALRAFNQFPRGMTAEKLLQFSDSLTAKNYKHARRNMQTLLDLLVTMEEVLLKSSNQTANLVTGDGIELDNSEDEEIASSDDDVGLNEKGCAAHASSSVLDEQEENSDGATSNDDPAIDRRKLDISRKNSLGKRKRMTLDATMAILEERHQKFDTYRRATLAKWDDRTRLIGVGAVKNAKKDFSSFDSMVLKQIDQILSEKNRLVRRTQTKRSDTERIGCSEEGIYDVELFDDDDFYQQLLKELIERKTASVVDPVEMSRQWLEIQKLRQKRSKRKKVDTRASKGRKIRYTVIPKLVNYFPSVPESVTWSHEARNQLFKSLFAS